MYMTFTWVIDPSAPDPHLIELEALDCFGQHELEACELADRTMLFSLPYEVMFERIRLQLQQVVAEHTEFSYVLIGNLLHGSRVWSDRFPPTFDEFAARDIVSP